MSYLWIKKSPRIFPDCYNWFLSHIMIPGGNASWLNCMRQFLQGVTDLCSVQLQKFTPCYQKRQKSHYSRLLLWVEINHLMLMWVARAPGTQMWFLILSGPSPPSPTQTAARVLLTLTTRKQSNNPNSVLSLSLVGHFLMEEGSGGWC